MFGYLQNVHVFFRELFCCESMKRWNKAAATLTSNSVAPPGGSRRSVSFHVVRKTWMLWCWCPRRFHYDFVDFPKKNVPDCQVLSDRFFHRGLYHLYPILDGSRTGNRISLSPLNFPCIFEAWADKLWPNCSTKPRRGKFPYLKTVTDVFNEEKQQTQVDKGDSKNKEIISYKLGKKVCRNTENLGTSQNLGT